MLFLKTGQLFQNFGFAKEIWSNIDFIAIGGGGVILVQKKKITMLYVLLSKTCSLILQKISEELMYLLQS